MEKKKMKERKEGLRGNRDVCKVFRVEISRGLIFWEIVLRRLCSVVSMSDHINSDCKGLKTSVSLRLA